MINGFCIHYYHRSYGVVLWEITSYGESPLDDMEAKDIVEAAENGTLKHSRSGYTLYASINQFQPVF